MKYYTETHEWVDVEGDIAIIGLTKIALDELGEVVYVELPEVGKSVKQKDAICIVESTKAAIDIYAPISGTVTEINDLQDEAIGKLNNLPESDGWLFKMRLKNQKELEALRTKEATETS